MNEFIEYSILGILSGGVTALVALSFVLIYKGTGVVNFAVGEVMMLGAYIYYACAVTFELAPWLSFIIALGVIGVLAVLVERAVLRPRMVTRAPSERSQRPLKSAGVQVFASAGAAPRSQRPGAPETACASSWSI